MNYRALAQLLGAQGRYGDTELVHVTKREKEMLRRAGGSGTTNPITGLDEYYEMDSKSISPNEMGASASASAGLSDLGPAIDVGTHPLGTEINVAPAVDVENANTPSGLSGLFSNFMSEFSKIGPSLSRDGPIAIPGLAISTALPGLGLVRGGFAAANTIANALGIPSGPAPVEGYDLAGAPGRAGGLSAAGSYGAGQTGINFSEVLPQYMGIPAAPSLAEPSFNQSNTPMQYKGLEPYMRDYLRRQGIFV